MIVQCDQCSTRFRLDDSKVKDGGVKVRCSKCKHIFIVRKELPQEESEFDVVLSGLGAQGDEKKEVESPHPERAGGEVRPSLAVASAPPPSQEEAPAGLRDERGFAEEEEKRREASPPFGEVPGFGDVSFREETPGAPSPASGETGGETEREEEIDFSSSAGEQPEAGIHVSSHPPERVTAGLPEEEGGPFPFEEEKGMWGEESFEPQAEMTQKEEEGEEFRFPVGAEEPPPSAVLQPATGTGFPEDETSELAAFTDDLSDSGEEESTAITTGESFPGEMPAIPVDGRPDTAATPVSGEETAPISAEHDVSEETASAPAAEKERRWGGDNLFAAAMKTAATPATPQQEELPPLSIPSRRRGASIFPIVITAISVLFIIALAGAGFYFLKEGPTGFNKVGLGFLATWFGMETVEEGKIAIRNPVGTFMKNNVAGEIFVISGEAVNNYRKPRALIQVKATLFGLKGEPLLYKTVFCGNVLTKEQLATLPFEKIEEAMNNQLGDSLANLGVQPAKGIPFVVVFANVPKDVGEFGVEVAGSSVASQ